MNRAVILLGSNLGDLTQNLLKAISLISEQSGKIGKTSLIYETEPWGENDQPVYYNQVVELYTSLSAMVLMLNLLNHEKKIGRVRTQKWAPRIIDLDILYFNDEVINDAKLIIPHPHLHERRFTLVPLSEIFPDMIHPLLKKKNKDLLATLKDNLRVKALFSETSVKS